MFDAPALMQAVQRTVPNAVIHQLTELAFAPGSPQYVEALKRNTRLRIDGRRQGH